MNQFERPRVKGHHAFYDQDYKRMERQGFKPIGWTDYHSSPYAEYERRVKNAIHTRSEDNKADNRTEKNRTE